MIVLALTACSSSSNPPVGISNFPATIDTGAGDVAGNFATSTTVQPDGSATETIKTSPPEVHTITLPSSLVLKFFNDLTKAMPLSSLPKATEQNAFAGSTVISVAGQTSPNILGDSGIAGTLDADVDNIGEQFAAQGG
jgi:hypothetical protein